MKDLITVKHKSGFIERHEITYTPSKEYCRLLIDKLTECLFLMHFNIYEFEDYFEITNQNGTVLKLDMAGNFLIDRKSIIEVFEELSNTKISVITV